MKTSLDSLCMLGYDILRVASTLRGGALVVNSPEKLPDGRKKREIRKTYNGESLQAPPFMAG
ncbi:hypothetical protein IH992_17755 [Candidatus Poribacteria bacterium]|nr:hypothetical protein [Candidatus Poribacteria bacterium]